MNLKQSKNMELSENTNRTATKSDLKPLLSVRTYGTYLKYTNDPKKSRNREANLSRNDWRFIAQYDLDENENAKESAIDTIIKHCKIQGINYTEGVYWIRYDFWNIPHIFIYAR